MTCLDIRKKKIERKAKVDYLVKNHAGFLYQVRVGAYFGREGVHYNKIFCILRASNTSLIMILDGYTRYFPNIIRV